jgi:hypothetical protein
MDFCSGCGAKLLESSHFCPNCGRPNKTVQDNNVGLQDQGNQKHSFFKHKKDNYSDYNAKKIVRSYSAKYLGGYTPLPRPVDTKMFLYDDKIIIDKIFLTIPYSKIINIENMDREKVTAKRFLLVGLFALAWKKKILYTVIEYDDGINTHHIVFDLGDHMDEVQPFIYQKMLESRNKNN